MTDDANSRVSTEPSRVQVGQYCINVTDLDRSVRFYSETVGLTVVLDVEYSGLHEVVLGSKSGGGQIQLAFTQDLEGPIVHGNALRKIYFNVDDCHDAHRRVVEAGWPSTHAPERLAGYPVTYAMVEDPDGYVIELIQRHDD